MKSQKLQNNKQLTKKIRPQQKETEIQDRITIWTKINKQSILFLQWIKSEYKIILFSLLLGTVFYSYQFIPEFSDRYHEANDNFQVAKKENTIALSEIKKIAKGTTEYVAYQKARQKKKESLDRFHEVKAEESVFGFKSSHFMLERFGIFFGFLMYAMYNLVRSFYFERKNKGSQFLHTFIISVCMFYFFWIFQTIQDFPKALYYLMTFLSAFIVYIIIKFITKYQDHYINKLKKNIKDLSVFMFLNTEKEKHPEMLETLEKVSKDYK